VAGSVDWHICAKGGKVNQNLASLVNVLNALTSLFQLEAQQADLLEQICDGPMLSSVKLIEQ